MSMDGTRGDVHAILVKEVVVKFLAGGHTRTVLDQLDDPFQVTLVAGQTVGRVPLVDRVVLVAGKKLVNFHCPPPHVSIKDSFHIITIPHKRWFVQ